MEDDMEPISFIADSQAKESKSTIPLIHYGKIILKQLLKIKNFYLSILIPLIYLPLIIPKSSQELKCAYVCLVTISFLVTQALPLALSSLLPALLFPMFGILTVLEVSSKYFQDPILLFFASVILAKGIQSANLHKRIALYLLMHLGYKPIWMIFGFIISTFFISIWINNSATAVLMVPVATGVMDEFYKFKCVTYKNKLSESSSKHTCFHESESEQTIVLRMDDTDPKDRKISDSSAISQEDDRFLQNLRKCIFIGIAYACNIGGTASLTGTPPNLIMSGFLNVIFGPSAEISFMTWLLYSFPGALIIIILTWLHLCIHFLGFRQTIHQFKSKRITEDPRTFIRAQLRELGSLKQNEVTMMVLFVTLVLLWVLKNPKFIPGWQAFFKPGYVSDATPALLIALLLFIIPRDFRSIAYISRNNDDTKIPDYQPLLVWEDVYKNLMWDINLLLGGGMALALGFKTSGLSKLLVKSFHVLHSLPKEGLVLIFSGLTSILTEFINNIATASILLPIIADISISLKLNPLYLMFPATLAASYCFMLPIGTAPNAIVFSAAKLKISDMMKAGIFVHLICWVVTYISINTYGIWVLKVNKIPVWAQQAIALSNANATTT